MIRYEDQAKAAAARPVPAYHSSESELAARHYNRAGYQLAKRLFDIVVSLTMLLLLFPLFAMVALIIAATEGMPILFRQSRVGKDGRLFFIYKFRTMVRNAEEVLRSRPELWEEYQKHYKIKDDPRISRIGLFLRHTTLDELPQLFNVLKGDMSIVGPRPIVQPELAMFGEAQNIYLQMKPGCAGLWQCSGRSWTTYEERVEMETAYFKRASFWYDLFILVRTVIAVLLRRGAA
ncbi:MAG TPA: sugar transferase [Fimbriimonadaceae bacterium]|nr:sugar transferase [Fimbriimonadaceae bacterium]